MPNTATIDSKIKVKINGQVQEFQIVSSADVDPRAGKISYLSPIGEAVLGREVGDIFKFELPNRKENKGTIVNIE